jgi:hypothetical protein
MKYLLLLLAPLVVMADERKTTAVTHDWVAGPSIYGPTYVDAFVVQREVTYRKGILECIFVSSKDQNPDVILGRLQKDLAAYDGKIAGLAVAFSGDNGPLRKEEAAKLVKLADKIGVEFTIAPGVMKRRLPNLNFAPYCKVFNSRGTSIYEGPYGGHEFEQAMKKAAILTSAGY